MLFQKVNSRPAAEGQVLWTHCLLAALLVGQTGGCGRVGYESIGETSDPATAGECDVQCPLSSDGQTQDCAIGCDQALCGDGVLNEDAGEECDDGDATANCDADCSRARCGDGVVNEAAGEECDQGAQTAGCNADCSIARCGDSIVNAAAGEACDEGGETMSCNADCSVAQCGDSVVNSSAGEECDEGIETSTCNADCTAATCGDGVVNTAAGEACDGPPGSSTCDDDCTIVGCGDGSVNQGAGEACDDGMESATCNLDCSLSSCGDGVRNTAAGEQCDTGGSSQSCDDDCTAPVCGDGVVNASAGEACDADGAETESCNLDCSLSSCGDGMVNQAAGEQCDPPGEHCAANCQHELRALVVHGDNKNVDDPLRARLGTLGYSVTSLHFKDVTPADATGEALVVISGSVDGPRLRDRLKNIPRPLMILEDSLYEPNGLGARDTVDDWVTATFSDRHPLAGGAVGTQPVLSLVVPVRGVVPSATTLVAAVRPGSSIPVHFAYEAGSEFPGGIAVARRVGSAFGKRPESWMGAAPAAFDAAVAWLTQSPVPLYATCEELLSKHPSLPDGIYALREPSGDAARDCTR